MDRRLRAVDPGWRAAATAQATAERAGGRHSQLLPAGPQVPQGHEDHGQPELVVLPEDLCSNYLGTVVAERALNAAFHQNFPMSFGANVNSEIRQTLMGLGVQSAAEARKAFDLINGRWVNWSNLPLNASAANPYYLRRRNFTNAPWLAGHPSDQPGAWAPTPFKQTTAYSYRHTLGFTNADFPREIAAITAWAKSKFGPDADKP